MKRSAITERYQSYRQRAELMEPVHEQGRPERDRRRLTRQSTAVIALLDLNDWLIARVRPDTPERWDPAGWPWIADIVEQVPAIREELLAYVGATQIPLVAEVAGFDVDSEGAKTAVPVRTGAWRTVLLFANGRWIDATAAHFPVTRSCFEHLHRKANVGFSALEGHSHIEAHVGANRGALRLQVPIIVPGEDGECRIRIGDDMVHWHEAEPIVFDLKVDHEAWNDTPDLRVLLMVEIPQPLPWPVSGLNRLAQYAMRWHPSYRELPERVDGLGRRASAGGATGDARP